MQDGNDQANMRKYLKFNKASPGKIDKLEMSLLAEEDFNLDFRTIGGVRV